MTKGFAPQMTVENVGDYFTRSDGSIWRLVCYSDQPTASLERLDGPERTRVGGVVGAPIFNGFVRLAPEVDVQECGAPNAMRSCSVEPCWCRRG